MSKFVFDAASHTYTLDGEKLPSVTTIIKPISHDFSMVDPEILEAKRLLGTAVHLACEADDENDLDDEATDPRVMGYVNGWRKFKEDTKAVILKNEFPMHHPALRFAGMIDRFSEITVASGRNPWAIDIKIADSPHPVFGVQTAGYVLLLDCVDGCQLIGMARNRRASVHLRPDATYRMKTYTNPNDEVAFRACLSIYRWKEMSK